MFSKKELIMIEKMSDLNLDKLDPKAEDYLDQLDNLVKESLGISFADLRAPIISYVSSHAEELSLQFPNIAPYGDYSKLIEDNDGMSEFLKKLDQPTDWKISVLEEDKKYGLLKFGFICTSVDDGDALEGFTYVTMNGKVKHSFAQYIG